MKNLILSMALLTGTTSFAGEVRCQADQIERSNPYAAGFLSSRQIVVQVDSSRYNPGGAFNEGSISLGSTNLSVHIARNIGTQANPELDLWLAGNGKRLSLVFDKDLKSVRVYSWNASSTSEMFASGACEKVDLSY